jgi:hypothetical protein
MSPFPSLMPFVGRLRHNMNPVPAHRDLAEQHTVHIGSSTNFSKWAFHTKWFYGELGVDAYRTQLVFELSLDAL